MISTLESFRVISPEPGAIETLINERGGIRVSVYLPIDRSPPESDSNPMRMRRLIDRVRHSLAANGMTESAANHLLEPLEAIVNQPEAYLRPASAIGFFLDHETASSIELPYPVDMNCHVGNRFLIKPLLRLYQRNPTFAVACLNRGDVRVFRGTRTSLKPVTVPGMPVKMKDITDLDDPEKSIQHHTAKTVSDAGRPGSSIAAHFHGQGLPSDLEDTQLVRFFRSVGQSLDKYLNGSHESLIVFGVQQNIGLFKKLHHFSPRTLLYSAHDPHHWSPNQIKDEAWALLREKLEEAQDASLDRLAQALGRKEAVAGVENCALAAAMGRIDFVAVASDQKIYGQCDFENMQVRIIEEGEPLCGNDLLDYIASETVRHGGKAIAVPADRIPGGRCVTATARFPMVEQ